MPYQYKREPLGDDEVNRLTNACGTFDERFVVRTLLDTGLRVGELKGCERAGRSDITPVKRRQQLGFLGEHA
jgi:integrase